VLNEAAQAGGCFGMPLGGVIHRVLAKSALVSSPEVAKNEGEALRVNSAVDTKIYVYSNSYSQAIRQAEDESWRD
jgi:hypothetical protein